MNRAAAFAALAFIALLSQGVLVVASHSPSQRDLRGDEIHYDVEARALAAGKPVMPLFVFPPLYSRFLALLYALVGPQRIAVEIAQAMLFVGSGSILWLLFGRAGIGTRAATCAIALLFLDPQVAAFAEYLWPEALHLFLMLILVHILTGGEEPSASRQAIAGAACGLCILTKSLLVPFVPVLLVVVGYRAGSEPLRRLMQVAAFSAGMLTAVGPVVVGNGRNHGYWGISNTGPFNAWVGLNDPASRTDYDSVVVPEGLVYLGSSSDPVERNRIAWSKVRALVRERGLLSVLQSQVAKQYPRLFDKESFFTDQLPGGRWRPNQPPTPGDKLLRAWAHVAYGLSLALAVSGAWLTDWRRRWRAAVLPALFLAYNLGLFLLLHVKTRYRVAFWPCMLFFAAMAVERLMASRATDPASRSARVSALAAFGGGVTACLALWLAFSS